MSKPIASRSSIAKPKPTTSRVEVLIAVRRTFVTPFDRTDIQDLISSMDDAIDQMNKTAKTIVLFEVTSFEPQMRQMSDIILQSAKLVLEAVPLLCSIGTNSPRLNALTSKIIAIEEEADDIYNRGLKALFLANRPRRQSGQRHEIRDRLRGLRSS